MHDHSHTHQHENSPQRQSGVVSWPPDTSSPAEDGVHDVLNPPGYAGNVRGAWDQRSLIYATGGAAKGEAQALVLVSFDPAIHLKGIKSLEDRSLTSPSPDRE